jgi:GH24 family phage-related lysozyme (muramidase)
MPRKQVNDLQAVKLGGAAHQVNTFVAAPRVRRTNGALMLSKALSGIRDVVVEKQELDIKQATDRKLYGASVYADTSRERLAGYETTKGSLRSMEDAEKYYLEATEQELDDPHAKAGYEEKRAKGLSLFRGKHAEFLAGTVVKERSDHVFKDYISTVMTDGIKSAEARKNDIAGNFGMQLKDLNNMYLKTARVLIAQGNLDQAEEVLAHKRGAGGTLSGNPDTAEEAKGLNKKLKIARKDVKDSRVAKFKEEREADALQVAKNEADFTDNILDNENLSFEEKILELNKKDVLGQVTDGYGTEARRYLKSQSEADVDNNGDAMAGIVARIYDVNELAERDPKNYLRGLNEIQNDIMKMRSNKELTKKEEQSLKKQIKTLTSPKVAKVATKLNRSFKESKKMFDAQLPVSFRGEAIRELFYATDMEEFQDEIEGKNKQEIQKLYKTKAIEVMDKINRQRRDAATNNTKDITNEDTTLLKNLGYSMEDVRSQAELSGMSEAEVIGIIQSKFKDTEVLKQTKPISPEGNQILEDEGVVKNDNGDHLSYRDPRGFPTGGHGHLLTEEEKKLYPEGSAIPEAVVEEWKEIDLQEADEDVSAIFGDVEALEVRKVLKNMAFTMGRTRLNKFTRLKEAIKNKDYKLAAKSMRDSLWYRQTGNRSKRLVARIEALT